jgi:hypothetical protein
LIAFDALWLGDLSCRRDRGTRGTRRGGHAACDRTGTTPGVASAGRLEPPTSVDDKREA